MVQEQRRITYGYSAYGGNDASQATGVDKGTGGGTGGTGGTTTEPYNAYRFNHARIDAATGSYNMGFRTYDPSLNRFLSRDMYNGAFADTAMTTDPYTGNRYTFGAGNPLSNVELDGHMLVDPGGGDAAPPPLHCGDPGFIGPCVAPPPVTSVVVNGSVGGIKAGTNLLPSLSNAERNAEFLRNWASTQGWTVKPGGGSVETWGYTNTDGSFTWMLKLKFQAGVQPGLQAGSLQPRFTARLDQKGTYTNPFTGQSGSKSDPLIGSNDPSANLSHVPLDEPWAKPGTLDLARGGLKLGGRVLLGVAVAYDVYDVATAPANQRVAVAARDAGGLAGGLAGGWAGAQVGGAIGSFAGPAGTVVGGVVGGIVGGVIGSGVGESIVSGIESLF